MRNQILALALTLGCTPADDTARPVRRPESSEPTDVVEILTAPIDTNLSLGDWLIANPRGSVGMRPGEGMPDRFFCQSVSTSLNANGRAWRRLAIFLIPAAPRGEELPTDTSRVAQEVCRLRAVWVESVVSDSQPADSTVAMLKAGLTNTLGPPLPSQSLELLGYGTGSWSEPASWKRDSTYVILGVAPSRTADPSAELESETRRLPPTIVGAAYERGRRLVPFSPDVIETDVEAPDREATTARADSAIVLSQLPALDSLRALLAWHRAKKQHTDSSREEHDTILVRAIRALADSSSMERSRRAAAFLAVDLAANMHANGFDSARETATSRDNERRKLFQDAGLTYDDAPLGAVYVYNRPFLWRAYQTDSIGPAGRSAFVELLESGWTTRAACGEGAHQYRRVIERGEKALARGRVDPIVHVYVARAYADIFSLSKGALDTYAKASDFAAQAPAARLKAIEHFRHALAGVQAPTIRRAVWYDAIKLMLGRRIDVRYYCVYD